MAPATLTRKFRRADQSYLKRRERLAAKHPDMPFWFVADHWPLFAGIVNISRHMAIYELLKRVIGLPGHVCELGCWNGANLVYLAKLVHLLKPHGLTEVIGFDSFEGLQMFDPTEDRRSRRLKGAYRGNPQLLEDVLRLYRLEDGVRLIKGRIEETLPAFLKSRREIRFSFVYLDADLYGPTKAGIELLYPRLLKGGIMAFDEYNVAAWPGETSAVHEVLGSDMVIHQVPFSRQPTGYIIK
jgi:hypothetical protein